MGLSRLSKRCSECPLVDTCKNKRMEAMAHIEPSATDLSAPLTAPILQPHEFRDVTIGVNTKVTIEFKEFVEALEKQMPKPPEHKVHEIYPTLGKKYY